MASWRFKHSHAGVDLNDGLRPLLDLRFADDVLLFAKSFSEAATLLDSLVQSFADVGLRLNANKTLVLTMQAQPPSVMQTNTGIELQIVDRDACHRWLGCMFTAGRSKQHCQDVRFHLTQAAKAFFANRWVLRDKNVSLGARLRFFQSVVTPVACFASGYRMVRSQDLQAMNVEFRKLLRSIVGPPQNIVGKHPGTKSCMSGMREHVALQTDIAFWIGGSWHFAIIGRLPGMWRIYLKIVGSEDF